MAPKVKEIVEEVKVEDASKEVSLSMTPEQKEEFIEFMRLKKAKTAVEESAKNFVTIRLNFRHNINGKRYTPGRVVVPEDIAGTLIYAEQSQKDAEIRLHMSNKRLVQIMQDGNTVPVRVTPAGVPL